MGLKPSRTCFQAECFKVLLYYFIFICLLLASWRQWTSQFCPYMFILFTASYLRSWENPGSYLLCIDFMKQINLGWVCQAHSRQAFDNKLCFSEPPSWNTPQLSLWSISHPQLGKWLLWLKCWWMWYPVENRATPQYTQLTSAFPVNY